jgi:Inorganic Pyrophosphatase
MTTALFKVLAESRLRDRHIQQIHQRSIANIPLTLKRIGEELETLREQIRRSGIGTDKPSEAKYLRLLAQRRQLEQSLAMSAKPADKPVDAKLQKSIEYGELLLDIYGSGVLIKGAAQDLEFYGRKLAECGDERGRAIGFQLLKGAKIQRVLKWQGFSIGVEYLPGDVRFKGTAHEKRLRSGYGHFRGYVGEDGEALDCYLFSGLFREIDDDEPSDRAFEVRQIKEDGTLDELKIMVGYGEKEEAEAAYLKEMPRSFFGGIREVKLKDLEQWRR